LYPANSPTDRTRLRCPSCCSCSTSHACSKPNRYSRSRPTCRNRPAAASFRTPFGLTLPAGQHSGPGPPELRRVARSLRVLGFKGALAAH
jgi:hypothetical protein